MNSKALARAGHRGIGGRREQNQVEIAGCGSCGGSRGSCGCDGVSAAYDPVALAAAKILDLIRRGGAMPTSMASSGVPLPPGVGGPGSFTANPPMVPPGDPGADYGPGNGHNGDWSGWGCNPGCYPPGYVQQTYADYVRRMCRGRAPYSDRCYDDAAMDTIYSAITAPIAGGASATITLAPTAGTFGVFYYRLHVRVVATGAPADDWTYTTPVVSGCPTPCTTILPIMGAFAQASPEACCPGIPLKAWLDRASEGVPLTTTITNTGAVDIEAQLEVRGYCCNSRIC